MVYNIMVQLFVFMFKVVSDIVENFFDVLCNVIVFYKEILGIVSVLDK